MKPSVQFTVLEWAPDGIHVIRVRIFGRVGGRDIDLIHCPHDLCDIAEIAQLVAKINNGTFRPSA